MGRPRGFSWPRPIGFIQSISNARDQMDEEKKPAQPEITEFKGKPVLRIPIVDDPSPDVTWHWMAFGKSKAKAILRHFEAIRKFAEES